MSMYLQKKLFYKLQEFYNLYGELDYDTEEEFRAMLHQFLVENDLQVDNEEQLIEAFIHHMPFKSWEY